MWADVGRHFQSKELLHFLLFKFCTKPVTVNYFCEKHGKDGRDFHFGVVSRHLEDIVVTELVTVDDVALHLSNIAHTTGIALKLKDPTQYTITRVECNLFTALFSWQRNTEKTVLASMLSHPQEFVEVAYTISSEKTTNEKGT